MSKESNILDNGYSSDQQSVVCVHVYSNYTSLPDPLRDASHEKHPCCPPAVVDCWHQWSLMEPHPSATTIEWLPGVSSSLFVKKIELSEHFYLLLIIYI